MLGVSSHSWSDFLANDKKSKQVEQIAAAVEASGIQHQDPRYTWMSQLVAALIGVRLRHSPSQIDYEMHLTEREPCVTMKEFKSAYIEWQEHHDDSVLDRCIEHGMERANAKKEEVALELVRIAVNQYVGELDAAAESFSRRELESHLHCADSGLMLLEHLWNNCAIAEFVAATASLEACLLLRQRLWRLVHFCANDADRPLRDRELKLMLAASRRCEAPVKLYFDTDPTRGEITSRPSNKQEQQARAQWLNAMRSVLYPALIDQVLQRFVEPNGILQVAINDHTDSGDMAWLLESENSPLYHDTDNVVRLLQALQQSSTHQDSESQFVLAKNAMDYLRLLTFTLRSASWVSDFRAFAHQHITIIEAAWKAAICIEPQFRSKQGFEKLRQTLLDKGISSDSIPEPIWMHNEKTNAAVA